MSEIKSTIDGCVCVLSFTLPVMNAEYNGPSKNITFITFIVLSAEPVTNHWLPGSTATDLTQPVWPLIT